MPPCNWRPLVGRAAAAVHVRRHAGAAALRAAQAACAWPTVVRAVEVAAVTAVVTLVAFSHTPTMSDTDV